MSESFRTPAGGGVDRGVAVPFTFDGRPYVGRPGDTLASALLANGVRVVGRSIALDRPRGIVAAGVDEPCAVVQVDAPFPEPMQVATTLELTPGLAATSIRGRGRLADRPDPARCDAVYAHCDVLVVGGGPAGRAAAAAAGAADPRARVLHASSGDSRAEWGRIRPHSRENPPLNGEEGEWGDAVPGVTELPRTTVVALNDDNFAIAVQRRPSDLVRERTWRIRAGRVVLATGAHERPIAFGGNDRPGVMLAGAAATYATRYAVRAGARAVIFTNNDSTDAVVAALRTADVAIVDVVDARAGRFVAATSAGPDGALVGVTLADGTELAADLLAVSGGWNPATQLWSQRGGTLRWADGPAAFVPHVAPPGVEIVGAANGDGLPDVHAVWVVPPPDGDWSQHFVDLQRDVTVPDVRRALGTGMRSVEHVKRYTTAGTAHDQGRTSGVLAAAVIAAEVGADLADVGTTTFRSPYVPVAFATLAGRSAGDLLDPVRRTPMHDRHAAAGAPFEDVGQWKRPWYYPRGPEDRDAAVLRECTAVRSDVGFMDASTLGKIDVQGPDAATFLDLIYTNLMSTLKVGAIRYGVMCHADGMVFDDGTVLRLAPDRFVLTTTTGNATAVLDWFEEWLQTEWPQLQVFCTSVTDQWATVVLAGPSARAVLAGLAPALAVANADFPFMTARSAVVAGVPARVCRISFSGELAYEINVAGDRGGELWDAVAATGATPYGTETMHVLRAEKGYPIVGQDTDGTVTPHDLGLGWAVSKKKPDFVGKRSFARAANQRADRFQLVALLSADGATRLREGTQLVAADTPEPLTPPVPMLGHVTSSYHSVVLDEPFALAMIKNGRARVGEELLAVDGARLVPVRVRPPVLVDPEGARRD